MPTRNVRTTKKGKITQTQKVSVNVNITQPPAPRRRVARRPPQPRPPQPPQGQGRTFLAPRYTSLVTSVAPQQGVIPEYLRQGTDRTLGAQKPATQTQTQTQVQATQATPRTRQGVAQTTGQTRSVTSETARAKAQEDLLKEMKDFSLELQQERFNLTRPQPTRVRQSTPGSRLNVSFGDEPSEPGSSPTPISLPPASRAIPSSLSAASILPPPRSKATSRGSPATTVSLPLSQQREIRDTFEQLRQEPPQRLNQEDDVTTLRKQAEAQAIIDAMDSRSVSSSVSGLFKTPAQRAADYRSGIINV